MRAAENIFDPAHYAGVRRPLRQAESLPPWCYTSRAFFDREIERVFRRHWLLIGHAGRIPDAGSYFTAEPAGAPIIVLRGLDGKIRAFANSCRHRGSRLVSGEGSCRAIACPYHGWSYALDGGLIAAAGMEQAAGFDAAAHGLIRVRLETWADFLFVNLDEGTVGLAGHLGDLPAQLGAHGRVDAVCVRRREYDVAANWKLCLENQRESYHVATVHRASLSDQYPDQLTARGAWSGSFLRHEGTIAARLDAETVFPPAIGPDGRALAGTYFVAVYPAAFFVFTADCLWWMAFQPLAPARTRIVVGSCFPRRTVERADFEAVVAAYFARLDRSHPEDNQAVIRQQQGLASPHARPGRLSDREAGVHAVDNWILDRVLDRAGAEG